VERHLLVKAPTGNFVMSFVCYLFLAHHCLPFSFISHQIFFNLSETWNHKVQHDSTRIIIAVVGTTSHSFSQVTHVNFFSYLLVKFITNKKQQSYDVTLLGGKNFFLHSFISSLMTLSNLALPMSNTANRKSFGSSMVPYYHDPSYSCFRTTKHGVYMSSWHCFLTWPISAISKMAFKMALHWLPSYAGTFRTFWSHLPYDFNGIYNAWLPSKGITASLSFVYLVQDGQRSIMVSHSHLVLLQLSMYPTSLHLYQILW
jgi:hypothetical protein